MIFSSSEGMRGTAASLYETKGFEVGRGKIRPLTHRHSLMAMQLPDGFRLRGFPSASYRLMRFVFGCLCAYMFLRLGFGVVWGQINSAAALTSHMYMHDNVFIRRGDDVFRRRGVDTPLMDHLGWSFL